jgi:hypothetical protein
MLDVEGVFLQAIQYTDAKGRTRVSPFIVAHSIKPIAAASVSRGFLDKFFVPTVVILSVVILVTTLFLFRKSRKPATSQRYAARPPGPGR